MNAVTSLSAFASLLPKMSVGWLLLSLRIGAMFLMTPIFHSASVPMTIRMLIVLALAAVMSWAWGSEAPAVPQDIWQAALAELALGCTMGLGILLAFAAVSFAGRLVDIQIGFGMAQVLDPITQRQIPVLTALLELSAVVLFFLLNGHHALLRGLAYSLEVFPIGRPWPFMASADAIVKQFAGLFTLGFALVAPVVLCVVLVEVALGVIARGLPQMNMLLMGAPVKVVAGLLALWAWIYGMSMVLNQVFASIASTWAALFSLAPAVPR